MPFKPYHGMLAAARVLCVVVPALIGLPSPLHSNAIAQSEDHVDFASIMPILRDHCTSCHNENQPRADLSLTSLDKVLAGSASGPVVVPGKLDASPLYLLAAHLEAPKMPPNKPRISLRELRKIERWILSGLLQEAGPSIREEGPSIQEDSPSNREIEGMQEQQNKLITIGPLTPQTQRDLVRAIAVHPNLPLIAIGADRQVMFADPSGKVESESLKIPWNEVTALRFRNNTQQLWIATGNPAEFGTLMGWDLANQKMTESVCEESDTIQAMDIAPHGNRFAIGTSERLLKVISEDNEALHELKKHTDWVLSVAFSPDGLLIASGDRFGGIQVWDHETGESFATFRGHTGLVSGLVWIDEGETLVSSGADGTIRLWNMHTQEASQVWTAHVGGVAGIVNDATGSLWSIGSDAKLRRWSLRDVVASSRDTKIAAEELPLPSEGIAIALGNLNRTLAVTDSNGGITTISLENESDRQSHHFAIPVVPDPRTLTVHGPRRPDRSTIASSVRETGKELSMNKATMGAEDSSIDSTRRALEEVEKALEQLRQTTAQLEQSANELRQILQQNQASQRDQSLKAK